MQGALRRHRHFHPGQDLALGVNQIGAHGQRLGRRHLGGQLPVAVGVHGGGTDEDIVQIDVHLAALRPTAADEQLALVVHLDDVHRNAAFAQRRADQQLGAAAGQRLEGQDLLVGLVRHHQHHRRPGLHHGAIGIISAQRQVAGPGRHGIGRHEHPFATTVGDGAADFLAAVQDDHFGLGHGAARQHGVAAFPDAHHVEAGLSRAGCRRRFRHASGRWNGNHRLGFVFLAQGQSKHDGQHRSGETDQGNEYGSIQGKVRQLG